MNTLDNTEIIKEMKKHIDYKFEDLERSLKHKMVMMYYKLTLKIGVVSIFMLFWFTIILMLLKH